MTIAVALLIPALASAQLSAPLFTRPGLAWETAHTAHFAVYYPTAMRAWALDMATHLEAERGGVAALVGSAPTHRVTVIVEDPYSAANGFAIPFTDAPAIFVWPTPAPPDEDIGDFRSWGTLVSVHEFAHIAHLTRPSRNAWQHTLWKLIGADASPLVRRSPRWLFEGYAVYVEGRITGGGRPYSAQRASVLRTLALEGKLPSYGALDGAPTYEGGEMAYLVGSAFLEWLVARSGEESLPHLWRRMTARMDRGFVPAFAGVFGGTPDELYGRFTAELTGKALAAAHEMQASGLDTGVTVQRLSWYTGAPAVSRDGQMLAIALHVPQQASRIVVWNMSSTKEDGATQRARRNLIANDSEDVAAVPYAPPPKTPVAVLLSHNGTRYDDPRFLSDGRHLLVIRDVVMADGTYRPDLFIWDRVSGHVHRVTHGAGIMSADPFVDGTAAIGVRCVNGLCDLVRIDLSNGTVRVILRGSPTRLFYRPRVASDERSIVVSVHDTVNDSHWHLALVTVDGAHVRDTMIGPHDQANRYQATFFPGGRSVVTVSDAGGVQHLETIDLLTGETRVVGMAYGALSNPEPALSDVSVYCLSLYSKGLTLNRIPLSGTSVSKIAPLDSTWTPAVTEIAPPTPALDSNPVVITPYHLGPREFRVLPGGMMATDGRYGTLSLIGTDPIGRLSWTLTAAAGDPHTWHGGALDVAWRGLPQVAGKSTFEFSAFSLEQHPDGLGTLDANYHGLSAAIEHANATPWGDEDLRLGGSIGSLALDDGAPLDRSLAFGEYGVNQIERVGLFYLNSTLALDGAVGNTIDMGWRRGIARASIATGVGTQGLRASASYGATNATAPAYEQLIVGGGPAPLTDSALYAQRATSPALPLGVAGGQQWLDYRFATDGPGPVWYYETFSAGRTFRDWHRIWGVDWAFNVPTITFVRLPAIMFDAGAAYSMSAPFADRLKGYIGLRYSP